MKASHRWLAELSGIDASPAEVAERLTRAGLEVEDIVRHGGGLDHVVVAEVRGVERVPDKDKLRLVTVFDGREERAVICGAPNVPVPGGRVVLAQPGAILPGGVEIRERKVGGVTSAGMLCSERELGIGPSEGGILVLGDSDLGRPGESLVQALALEDSVFEISLTPNRPDCLGHIGLAREVALAFGVSFRSPSPGVPPRVLDGEIDESEGFSLVAEAPPVDTLTLVHATPGVPTRVPIRVEARDRCPRYAGGVVHGVKVGPSPFWMRYRLHVLGVRSISNVVDVTNWVLFEVGHPLHAFDLARLRGPELVVRLAREGERMRTLDGDERNFSTDDLLICDAEGPVAVAGIMGGAETEIREDTRDVMLEVAYFDPRSVRRTSRRLGIHSDSSHRFERGVDPLGVPWAMRRAVALLSSLANGAAAPVASEVRGGSSVQVRIDFDPDHVRRLLGVEVTPPDVRAALEGIGCSISPGETHGWRVTAPSWRPDVGRPEDLVEEVARIRGYDAIPASLPRVLPSGGGVTPRLRAARRLRESAADLGLLEAVTFAFVSRADLARARISDDALTLANPLSEERAVMRTSLLPGLLAAIARTRRHQGRAVALFELARTYHPRAGEPLPEERLELAFVLAGPRIDQVGEVGDYDFYDGKGMLESILHASLGVALTLDSSLDAASFHPRRRARVLVAGETVGVLGELHPDVSEAFELGARAIHAALDVDALLRASAALGLPRAKPLPRFPAMARDLAVVVGEGVTVGAVADVLREAGAPLLEAVELFDVYRGKGIPEGAKSLAYRLLYRDLEATLTDKRVEQAHRAAVRAVTERLSASVRE